MSDTGEQQQRNIILLLRQIICEAIVPKKYEFNDYLNLMKEIRNKLNLPVTAIKLSDECIKKSVNLFLYDLSIPLVLSAVFNDHLSEAQMYYKIPLSNSNINIKDPLVFHKELAISENCEPVSIEIENVFYDLKLITAVVDKEKDRQYCIYYFSPYKSLPTLFDVTKALRYHIESEYMTKVPGQQNPIYVPTGDNNLKDADNCYKDENFLEKLIKKITDNAQLETAVTIVNIDKDCVSPCTFECKNGNCGLTIVVNQNNNVYEYFDNETYFPRYTLDDTNTNPQIHVLCFVIVRSSEGFWNVITLRFKEWDIVASDVIENAKALVYIDLDITPNNFNYMVLINSILNRQGRSLRELNRIKQRINKKLLTNYYTEDKLIFVYDELQKAYGFTGDKEEYITDNIKNVFHIVRFYSLCGDYQSGPNNTRTLTFSDHLDTFQAMTLFME